MVIFESLINLMDKIINIYLNLSKLEILGELNTSYFFSVVGDLKKLLIEEENLFFQFINSDEYEYVKESIFNEKGPVFSRLTEYIRRYENAKIEADTIEKEDLGKKLRKIYEACARDVYLIQLSLYQDYIDSVTDISIKERMIHLKYYNAFTKLLIGQILIENDFKVDKVNYINSYLVADMVNLKSMDAYDIILDGNKDVILEMVEQLFNIDDKAYNDQNVVAASKGIEFLIRACFAMHSDSEYERIKDFIFDKIDELSNSKNNRAYDIIDNIIENRRVDRARVRKISLRPIED